MALIQFVSVSWDIDVRTFGPVFKLYSDLRITHSIG